MAVTEADSEIEAVRGRYIGSHRGRDKGWQKQRQRQQQSETSGSGSGRASQRKGQDF